MELLFDLSLGIFFVILRVERGRLVDSFVALYLPVKGIG